MARNSVLDPSFLREDDSIGLEAIQLWSIEELSYIPHLIPKSSKES